MVWKTLLGVIAAIVALNVVTAIGSILSLFKLVLTVLSFTKTVLVWCGSFILSHPLVTGTVLLAPICLSSKS